ncbi:MAG: hypothetical protein BAJATHORv1_70106 [Candidatus Thorarchaeota archaeon]|nr:MAG: hypothetical protein BAJATHORv1_70106 [Candidatus Thorarchaeota archaeon]
MSDWRLLDTGVLSGAENMALDDVILECRSENETPNTVRFLQFNPSTVLVGYHQSIEQEVRLEYCNAHDIGINRRITGGGAILFTSSCLGWEVFADKSAHKVKELRHDLDKLARRVCEGTISGLKRLGVDAEFRPKNDIEVEGRKISGTGGTERGNSFMYQGTLLVDFDVELMLRSLRIPVEKLQDKEIESVKERVTCLKWELGHVPPIEEIKAAITAGFEEVFDISLRPQGLLPCEQEMYEQRLPEFQDDEWIYLVQRPKNTGGHVNSMRKTPGGIVRVSINLDIPGNFIIGTFITGDFQVFPQRAIMDLEARLKNAPADEDSIRTIITGFFQETGANVVGVEPEDFIQLIIEAVKKTVFTKYGISVEQSNYLMPVNFMPDRLDEQVFDYVLLPYCAKLIGCDYRFSEGCDTCGACTISPVYELVKDLGVAVRTIQNYEDLIETIDEFRKKGARGYIGSCCDAFRSKHHYDFVETGVPALLIDVDDSTCYDLGEEQDAYAGDFQGQTTLKLDLLMHIIQEMWNRGILRNEVH